MASTARPVAKKQTKNITEYKKLNLNGEFYEIGDAVVLKEYKDDCCYGTILKIWKEVKNSDAYAKIRWFYKPSDIFHEHHDFISCAELFDSDYIQDVWIQTIYDKVRVLPFEEYHNLDEVDDNTFFWRAVYNSRDSSLTPPLSEWKRACVCNKIFNPDVLYVSCDNCLELFHPECVNADLDAPEWICDSCIACKTEE
ncbi:unnamed protein product [Blepharisma stoltei]|uniref:BAH domain-containing protein n=1 Tax=Blepharisma stoltei TaxID=1481888 RepID=A0AAU9JHI3_9CILI|nr:unnamed protein product [Blepharisma stoltei]